jgi:SAM-dependent methyltransferase
MKKLNQTGSLSLDYAQGRDKKKSLRYRLWRRTQEVLSAIQEFADKPLESIIDLGTADGRMLDRVHQKYPGTSCTGVEYSTELVAFGKESFPELQIIQGDIQSLDFPDNSFNVVIATAVIEHVPDPDKAMCEAKRVLKPGGILILTAPDPAWERIATFVGHLKEDQHNEVMNLSQLCDLVKRNGFVVLKSQKFMLSPIGMPFELEFEKILRSLRLNFLMANQLLVARC